MTSRFKSWLSDFDPFIVFLYSYILGGVICFGHIWTHLPAALTPPDRFLFTVWLSLGWPLYLSVQLWSS